MKTFVFVAISVFVACGLGSSAGAAVNAKKTAATETLDRPAVIFKKCTEIEKLSKKKSAVKCLDRFLDRMDFEVGTIENRIMRCGDKRRLEHFENGEAIRAVVNGEMKKLRTMQASAIARNVQENEKSGIEIGPRRMKEIELRAAEAHWKNVTKLAQVVCDRASFAKLMKR